MGTVAVVVVLVIIVILAISPTIKHIKGNGGCCGGGDEIINEKKKLEAPKLGEKEVHIEGMHCENCKKQVERAVNDLEGVMCKVNLKKKIAQVSYSREITEEELRGAIESAGYEVVAIWGR